jgi:hypothetical protein
MLAPVPLIAETQAYRGLLECLSRIFPRERRAIVYISVPDCRERLTNFR